MPGGLRVHPIPLPRTSHEKNAITDHKAKGSERIYLPVEMEHEAGKRALEVGMILPDDVMQHLEGLADDYGQTTKKLYA